MALWCLAFLAAGAQARSIVHAELTSKTGDDMADAETVAALRQLFPPARTATSFETVWQGRDVDGDGAADFANPTGKAPREHDSFGSGQFGASRDGGARHHEGVDYISDAGQPVVAPISGFVSKVGFAYDDDNGLRYVEITNPALGYVARVFYIRADVVVGQAVRVGTPIGEASSLQGRYPGITDHVHLELSAGAGRMDATRMIAARNVRTDLRG
ncbi:MAG TPA: M23 family metallopeptidase [Phenylobacterium sp.]